MPGHIKVRLYALLHRPLVEDDATLDRFGKRCGTRKNVNELVGCCGTVEVAQSLAYFYFIAKAGACVEIKFGGSLQHHRLPLRFCSPLMTL
jgi:hypothetical protein